MKISLTSSFYQKRIANIKFNSKTLTIFTLSAEQDTNYEAITHFSSGSPTNQTEQGKEVSAIKIEKQETDPSIAADVIDYLENSEESIKNALENQSSEKLF